MLTVDQFSVYLLSRVDIVIRYIEVDSVVSQADYTDHLVFAPGTLGQCKARQLRLRKHGDDVLPVILIF